MRALITGDRGFVGRHFRHRLEADGWYVRGVDIADPDHPLDCRDGFRDNAWGGVDLMIHCAATIPPIDQRVRSDLVVAQDFALDAEMFQWAERVRPRKIVYFSSSAAYPVALQDGVLDIRLTEGDLRLDKLGAPDAMYGMTKLVGELQASEARMLGIDVLVVRPFTGYGSDQDENYPFRAFIERAKRREPIFDVWGNGSQVRDFIHIDDIVEAVLLMAEQGFDGPVNLGTGIPTTLLDFAERVIGHIPGYHPEIRLIGSKPTGAVYRCCDPTKLHQVWKPQVGLDEGIWRALA